MTRYAIINDFTGEAHFADTFEEAEEFAMELSMEDGETYAIYRLKANVKAPPQRRQRIIDQATYNGVEPGVDYPGSFGR